MLEGRPLDMEGGHHSLAALQYAFQDYLLGKSGSFSSAVRDTRNAGREKLLSVYHDAYYWRLIEVLINDYPGVMAMAGALDFEHMARAYISAYPSRYRSVRWFGMNLPDFLAETTPFKESPSVVEMARFELAMGNSFDAPDASTVAAGELIALPTAIWDALVFTPVPSLRRLCLSFDIPEAWERRGEVTPGDLRATKAEKPRTWLIWRAERITRFRAMEPVEASLLEAMIAGYAFPKLCDSIAHQVGEAGAAACVARFLRGWVEAGLIAGFAY